MASILISSSQSVLPRHAPASQRVQPGAVNDALPFTGSSCVLRRGRPSHIPAGFPSRIGLSGRRIECRSSKTSQISQEQAGSRPGQTEAKPHMLHVDPSAFDLSYWHYKPWWWQPSTIIGSGVAFVVMANILDEACLKTTVLACCTVGVWWGVCLYALPRSFRSFATQYIDSHDFPEDQLQQQVQEIAMCCVDDGDDTEDSATSPLCVKTLAAEDEEGEAEAGGVRRVVVAARGPDCRP